MNSRMPRLPQKKSEYDERVLEVRRVTRVMAGGKRFSFRATVVIGNKKGKVGVGVAKGLDVSAAVQKAKRYAEKDILVVPLYKGRTISHDVEGKYSAGRVRIRPAREGHGLIAGGSVRTVLDLVGLKDVSAKILGTSKNKINNARAALNALESIRSKESQK